MTYIDTSKLPGVERLPGWRGCYFNSLSMTFAHYEFDAGASIHEHSHPQEEVYEVIEGELEITINGVTQRLVPGYVGIVPPNALHSVKAISRGKVIVVDYPLRDPPPPSGNARLAALNPNPQKGPVAGTGPWFLPRSRASGLLRPSSSCGRARRAGRREPWSAAR